MSRLATLGKAAARGPAPPPQVLMGDVEDAICLHAFYYAIWKRYGALPERFNWQLQAPDVLFYPLRPELVESTYLLYQVRGAPAGRRGAGTEAGWPAVRILHVSVTHTSTGQGWRPRSRDLFI